VQQFVRRFMNQTNEVLGWRQAGQDGDFAAVADAEGRRDLLVVFERDILPSEKFDEPIPVLACIPGNVVLELGQVRSLGLRHVLSRDLRPRFYAPMVRATRLRAPGDSSQGKWLLWRSTVSRERPKD
jgi:hypothetical protein